MSITSRQQGNDAFMAGNFAEADRHYTDAIAALSGRTSDQHLVHCNRS